MRCKRVNLKQYENNVIKHFLGFSIIPIHPFQRFLCKKKRWIKTRYKKDLFCGKECLKVCSKGRGWVVKNSLEYAYIIVMKVKLFFTKCYNHKHFGPWMFEDIEIFMGRCNIVKTIIRKLSNNFNILNLYAKNMTYSWWNMYVCVSIQWVLLTRQNYFHDQNTKIFP